MRVRAWTAALGATLLIASAAGAQPANDDCASPTVVTSLPFSETLDVSAATSEPGDPYVPCGSFTRDIDALSGSVWYEFTAAVGRLGQSRKRCAGASDETRRTPSSSLGIDRWHQRSSKPGDQPGDGRRSNGTVTKCCGGTV